jgi:hypothetical protein
VTTDATPPTYLWQGIVCFLLFFPLGVVALMYSAQVKRQTQLGDMSGAVRASRLARTWCLLTVLAAAVILVLLVAAGGLS